MKKNRKEILEKYNSAQKIEVSNCNLMPYLLSLAEFMDKSGTKLRPYPKFNFSKDASFKNDPMGKTAWYSPETKEVTLITEGRHPKDILRSAAHELIHHSQNLSGKMSSENLAKLADPQYAQKNESLNELEKEAYTKGNLIFRSWEDQYK